MSRQPENMNHAVPNPVALEGFAYGDGLKERDSATVLGFHGLFELVVDTSVMVAPVSPCIIWQPLGCCPK